MGRALENRELIKHLTGMEATDVETNMVIQSALMMDISTSLAQIADDLHMMRKEGVKTK